MLVDEREEVVELVVVFAKCGNHLAATLLLPLFLSLLALE